MKSFVISLLLLVGISACTVKNSGPPSVQATSEVQSELADRVKFLEQYLSFRRNYTQLEYNLSFYNGSGLVPSPSEWDIKLLAVIPKEEIQDWIPPNTETSEEADAQWLSDIPGSIPTDGLTEWYQDGQRTIGIDRTQSIIAYRNFAY